MSSGSSHGAAHGDAEPGERVVQMPVCVICSEDLDVQGLSMGTSYCGHVYHYECLLRWVQGRGSQGSCPECRQELCEDDVFPLYLNFEAARPKVERVVVDEVDEAANRGVGAAAQLEAYKDEPAKIVKLCKWLMRKRKEDAAAAKAKAEDLASTRRQLQAAEAAAAELERESAASKAQAETAQKDTRALQAVLANSVAQLDLARLECAEMQDRVAQASSIFAVHKWADDPESQSAPFEGLLGELPSDPSSLHRTALHLQTTTKVLQREHRRLKRRKDELAKEKEATAFALAQSRDKVKALREKNAALKQEVQRLLTELDDQGPPRFGGLELVVERVAERHEPRKHEMFGPTRKRTRAVEPGSCADGAHRAATSPGAASLTMARSTNSGPPAAQAGPQSSGGAPRLLGARASTWLAKQSFKRSTARSVPLRDTSKYLREGVDPLGVRRTFKMQHD